MLTEFKKNKITTLCRYDCMYFFAALVPVCVDIYDGDINGVGHDLNRYSRYDCAWNVSL